MQCRAISSIGCARREVVDMGQRAKGNVLPKYGVHHGAQILTLAIAILFFSLSSVSTLLYLIIFAHSSLARGPKKASRRRFGPYKIGS